MFSTVDLPERTRKSKLCDYNALADAVKALEDGKAVLIEDWKGSMKAAKQSISSNLINRGVKTSIMIVDGKIYVSKKA